MIYIRNIINKSHIYLRKGIAVIPFLFFFLSAFLFSCGSGPDKNVQTQTAEEAPWRGWNKYQIKPEDTMVVYGRELIENTAYYFGPKGTIAAITNGMNCQNCHLDGGTLPWANNYSAVVSTYPKFRDRSGSLETIPKRVNDCFERSLNGIALDTTSREMKSILAYLHWVGDEIPKGKKPKGSGIMDLPYLDRAADPAKGKVVYQAKCVVCHGNEGQGQPNIEGYGYAYPPLWGKNSYNSGAGLFRLSRFAGFVKNSMPFGQTDYHNPSLSNEEAWDVAAYVNAQPRPQKDLGKDWPDISKKPVDHPFGPYADGFSEIQHKFGPFQPIIDARKKNASAKKG